MGLLGNVGDIISQTERAAKVADLQQVIDWCMKHSGKKTSDWEADKTRMTIYVEDEKISFQKWMESMKKTGYFNSNNFRAEYLIRKLSTYYWPDRWSTFPYLCENLSDHKIQLYTRWGANINRSNVRINEQGECLEIHDELTIVNYPESELPDWIHIRPGTKLYLIECPNLNRTILSRDGIDWGDLGIQVR